MRLLCISGICLFFTDCCRLDVPNLLRSQNSTRMSISCAFPVLISSLRIESHRVQVCHRDFLGIENKFFPRVDSTVKIMLVRGGSNLKYFWFLECGEKC